MLVLRFARSLLRLLLAISIVLALLAPAVRRPADLPWTPLRSLEDRPGAFTGRKLAALADDPAACLDLLARAGVVVRPVPPPNGAAPACRVVDGVTIARSPRVVPLQPVAPLLACPLAAALVIWERQVVEPAARATYGRGVAAIDHLGSYSCRRIYGRASGDWSEHAHADAIDIAGFRLEDGRSISVAGGWSSADGMFLHRVRDGACPLFATVLSPDYNAAHRDHLHLDQAPRGAAGWRACR